MCVCVSGKQSSLNLNSFVVSLNSKLNFLLSFNLVESSIKLSFSRIPGLNFQL